MQCEVWCSSYSLIIFHITKPEKNCNALYPKEHKSLQLWIKRTFIASDRLPNLLNNQRAKDISILTFWTFQQSKPWQKLSEPIHDKHLIYYTNSLYKDHWISSETHEMSSWAAPMNTRLPINYIVLSLLRCNDIFNKWQELLNHAQEDLIVIHSMCSCVENFTLVTRPMASKLRIAHQVMSSCHHFSPWCGEYSKALWLLCHSSPNEINATHLKIRVTTYGGKWTSSQMHVMISSSHQTKDCFKSATK
jgi:hypothetical protein